MKQSWYFIIFLSCVACSPKFKIQTDTPAPGDFEHYSTFKFYNPANIPAANFSFEEHDQKAIFDALAAEMKLRGYQSRQQADLMIKVQGGTKSTVEIKNQGYYPYNNNYNSMYYDNGPYGNYYDRPRDESKKELTIIIDMIDVSSGKIVWQGVGSGALGKGNTVTPDQIKSAIAALMDAYPYRAGGLK